MTEAACPSVDEVDATAAIAEPILRNLRITSGYGQLARAFHAWLPDGANWCAFATWASRQAGVTIRKEDLGRAVAERLHARLAHRPVLRELHAVFGISGERLVFIVGELSQGLPGIDRTSDALARGNRMVFGHIGHKFARFLTALSERTVAAFIDGLAIGPPPEGEDLLRRAFANYLTARGTDDARARAELTLLANVQIGVHEQMRVQPLIVEAMDAALLDVADTRRLILERLDAMLATGPLGHLHTDAGRRLLNRVADEVAEELRMVVRTIVTGRLMSMQLPGGVTLRLGSDVSGTFPSTLATLTNPELIALLAHYDRTPDSTLASGAVDWSVLTQRLHFIADFFRAYQDDARLFEMPFDAAQLDAIAADRVPDSV